VNSFTGGKCGGLSLTSKEIKKFYLLGELEKPQTTRQKPWLPCKRTLIMKIQNIKKKNKNKKNALVIGDSMIII
jgi:hypothetical protein